MARLLPALLAVLLPALAAADDEGSEHTAVLLGDPADTLGVRLTHDAKAGWAMDHRARPGAPERHVALPFLPADHAHYLVAVAPGRGTLTFVTTSRERLAHDTPVIWIATADGKVVKSWRLGDVLTKPELGKLRRSISHTWWLGERAQPSVTGATLALPLAHRTIRIDAAARTLRSAP